MKKFILLFLFAVFYNASAQDIQGTVSFNDEPVAFVMVTIKKTTAPNLVFQYTKTDACGFYKIPMKTLLDSIIVEISSPDYEPEQKIIGIQKKGNPVTIDFKLEKRTTALPEITINYKSNPVTVKNDTTTYNPNKFRDGSEKVVEDLLKKLPGVKVEENGEIKFKGKSIRKLLLDGDDLFDNQYVIGSRNIDVDMVDKVEAIENFNENPLLKGLKNDDDVAINLKFKKGKSDFSGNADLGYGYQNRHNYIVTGILLNSKAKAFATSSFNNIGTNNSPYDFHSEVLSVDEIEDATYNTATLISEGSFYSQLEDKLHRINANFYTSISALYKLSKKTTAKINLGFYDDKLKRHNQSETIYNINDQIFSVSETESLTKSPRLYNANLQLTHKPNETLAWEYLGKMNFQETAYSGTSFNNTLIQKNDVQSAKWFTKHNFNLTNRISENSALTSSLLYTKSRAPQNYAVSPGIATDGNEDIPISENNQNSRFDKEIIDLYAEYLHRFGDFKWLLRIGYFSQNNQLETKLSSTDENGIVTSDTDFQNSMHYGVNYPLADGNLVYNKDKFGFRVGFGSKYYHLKLNDNVRDNVREENNLLFTPNVKFVYRFAKNLSTALGYSYNQSEPGETNLFEGIVQTGYRSFQTNEVSLDYLKTHRYTFNISYNDLFNMTRLTFGISSNQRRNNYFNKTVVNSNTNVYSSFLLNTGNKDYAFYLSVEKYLHFLKTTFEFNVHYNVSFDKNIINGSDLRDIHSENLSLELLARTGRISRFLIENKVGYTQNNFSLEGVSSNQFRSFKNTSKVVFRAGDRLKIIPTLNFIAPDLSLSKNYWFLDSEITFSSKNKKIDYSIIGRNLTNNQRFETVSISDFSKSVSSHNLVSRYILGSISFKF